MGKRIPYDTALRIAKTGTDNTSVYAPLNKYGYKINVNHPDVRPLYEAYKRKLGAPVLSDGERFKFEAAIIELMKRRGKI